MINFWQIVTIFGDIQFWLGAATTALILYALVPKAVKSYFNWFIFGVLPSIAISWGVVEVLKRLFQLPRPCTGLEYCPPDFSFPSGHAAVIFSAMTVAIFYSKKRRFDLMFATIALLVTLSRLFLGVHKIEDLIGGAAIGAFVGYITYKNHKEIHDLIKKSHLDRPLK